MDDAENAHGDRADGSEGARAAKSRPKKKSNGFGFEESLKRLEEVVRRLEEEQIPLEESLRLFTEGKKLANLCEAELQKVENRVRQLIEDAEGKINEAPLETAARGAEPDEDEIDEIERPPRRPLKDDLPF